MRHFNADILSFSIVELPHYSFMDQFVLVIIPCIYTICLFKGFVTNVCCDFV